VVLSPKSLPLEDRFTRSRLDKLARS